MTLIELVMTVVMFVILAGVTLYLFRAILIGWSGQETRAGINIGIDRAMEEMVRDLREANDIKYLNNDEIRFTQDGADYYIYYFYNESDSYPPNFNQSSYQLRKAALIGDIEGALDGVGRVIITDVVPPPASDLSEDPDIGNVYIIDLTIERGSETIRSRTQIMPRNL